jgi:branched-chain amino acid transport system permease protein
LPRFAGVLAAPIYSVNPLMGADLIIVVFAVVVIGGMGSIMGAIVTGFGLGLVEGLTKVFYPEASNHRDLHHHGHRAAREAGGPVREDGLMADIAATGSPSIAASPKAARQCRPAPIGSSSGSPRRSPCWPFIPVIGYPFFLMKVLCFALFACAFNLLLGYGGLLSFGHAAYFGWRLRLGLYRQALGPDAGTRRSCSARPPARCWASSSARSPSAGRASTSP